MGCAGSVLRHHCLSPPDNEPTAHVTGVEAFGAGAARAGAARADAAPAGAAGAGAAVAAPAAAARNGVRLRVIFKPDQAADDREFAPTILLVEDSHTFSDLLTQAQDELQRQLDGFRRGNIDGATGARESPEVYRPGCHAGGNSAGHNGATFKVFCLKLKNDTIYSRDEEFSSMENSIMSSQRALPVLLALSGNVLVGDLTACVRRELWVPVELVENAAGPCTVHVCVGAPPLDNPEEAAVNDFMEMAVRALRKRYTTVETGENVKVYRPEYELSGLGIVGSSPWLVDPGDKLSSLIRPGVVVQLEGVTCSGISKQQTTEQVGADDLRSSSAELCAAASSSMYSSFHTALELAWSKHDFRIVLAYLMNTAMTSHNVQDRKDAIALSKVMLAHRRIHHFLGPHILSNFLPGDDVRRRNDDGCVSDILLHAYEAVWIVLKGVEEDGNAANSTSGCITRQLEKMLEIASIFRGRSGFLLTTESSIQPSSGDYHQCSRLRGRRLLEHLTWPGGKALDKVLHRKTTTIFRWPSMPDDEDELVVSSDDVTTEKAQHVKALLDDFSSIKMGDKITHILNVFDKSSTTYSNDEEASSVATETASDEEASSAATDFAGVRDESRRDRNDDDDASSPATGTNGTTSSNSLGPDDQWETAETFLRSSLFLATLSEKELHVIHTDAEGSIDNLHRFLKAAVSTGRWPTSSIAFSCEKGGLGVLTVQVMNKLADDGMGPTIIITGPSTQRKGSSASVIMGAKMDDVSKARSRRSWSLSKVLEHMLWKVEQYKETAFYAPMLHTMAAFTKGWKRRYRCKFAKKGYWDKPEEGYLDKLRDFAKLLYHATAVDPLSPDFETAASANLQTVQPRLALFDVKVSRKRLLEVLTCKVEHFFTGPVDDDMDAAFQLMHMCVQYSMALGLKHLLHMGFLQRLVELKAHGRMRLVSGGDSLFPVGKHLDEDDDDKDDEDMQGRTTHPNAEILGSLEVADGDNRQALPWHEAAQAALLTTCVLLQRYDCLELLLEHGADPNSRTCGWWRLGTAVAAAASPRCALDASGSFHAPATSFSRQQKHGLLSGSSAAWVRPGRGQLDVAIPYTISTHTAVHDWAYYKYYNYSEISKLKSANQLHHAAMHVRPLHVAADKADARAMELLLKAGASEQLLCYGYIDDNLDKSAAVPDNDGSRCEAALKRRFPEFLSAVDLAILRGCSSVMQKFQADIPYNHTVRQIQLERGGSVLLCSTVRVLQLSGIDLHAADLTKLCSALKVSPALRTLQCLDLTFNKLAYAPASPSGDVPGKLEGEGLQALSDLLCSADLSLQELHLLGPEWQNPQALALPQAAGLVKRILHTKCTVRQMDSLIISRSHNRQIQLGTSIKCLPNKFALVLNDNTEGANSSTIEMPGRSGSVTAALINGVNSLVTTWNPHDWCIAEQQGYGPFGSMLVVAWLKSTPSANIMFAVDELTEPRTSWFPQILSHVARVPCLSLLLTRTCTSGRMIDCRVSAEQRSISHMISTAKASVQGMASFAECSTPVSSVADFSDRTVTPYSGEGRDPVCDIIMDLAKAIETSSRQRSAMQRMEFNLLIEQSPTEAPCNGESSKALSAGLMTLWKALQKTSGFTDSLTVNGMHIRELIPACKRRPPWAPALLFTTDIDVQHMEVHNRGVKCIGKVLAFIRPDRKKAGTTCEGAVVLPQMVVSLANISSSTEVATGWLAQLISTSLAPGVQLELLPFTVNGPTKDEQQHLQQKIPTLTLDISRMEIGWRAGQWIAAAFLQLCLQRCTEHEWGGLQLAIMLNLCCLVHRKDPSDLVCTCTVLDCLAAAIQVFPLRLEVLNITFGGGGSSGTTAQLRPVIPLWLVHVVQSIPSLKFVNGLHIHDKAQCRSYTCWPDFELHMNLQQPLRASDVAYQFEELYLKDIDALDTLGGLEELSILLPHLTRLRSLHVRYSHLLGYKSVEICKKLALTCLDHPTLCSANGAVVRQPSTGSTAAWHLTMDPGVPLCVDVTCGNELTAFLQVLTIAKFYLCRPVSDKSVPCFQFELQRKDGSQDTSFILDRLSELLMLERVDSSIQGMIKNGSMDIIKDRLLFLKACLTDGDLTISFHGVINVTHNLSGPNISTWGVALKLRCEGVEAPGLSIIDASQALSILFDQQIGLSVENTWIHIWNVKLQHDVWKNITAADEHLWSVLWCRGQYVIPGVQGSKSRSDRPSETVGFLSGIHFPQKEDHWKAKLSLDAFRLDDLGPSGKNTQKTRLQDAPHRRHISSIIHKIAGCLWKASPNRAFTDWIDVCQPKQEIQPVETLPAWEVDEDTYQKLRIVTCQQRIRVQKDASRKQINRGLIHTIAGSLWKCIPQRGGSGLKDTCRLESADSEKGHHTEIKLTLHECVSALVGPFAPGALFRPAWQPTFTVDDGGHRHTIFEGSTLMQPTGHRTYTSYDSFSTSSSLRCFRRDVFRCRKKKTPAWTGNAPSRSRAAVIIPIENSVSFDGSDLQKTFARILSLGPTLLHLTWMDESGKHRQPGLRNGVQTDLTNKQEACANLPKLHAVAIERTVKVEDPSFKTLPLMMNWHASSLQKLYLNFDGAHELACWQALCQGLLELHHPLEICLSTNEILRTYTGNCIDVKVVKDMLMAAKHGTAPALEQMASMADSGQGTDILHHGLPLSLLESNRVVGIQIEFKDNEYIFTFKCLRHDCGATAGTLSPPYDDACEDKVQHVRNGLHWMAFISTLALLPPTAFSWLHLGREVPAGMCLRHIEQLQSNSELLSQARLPCCTMPQLWSLRIDSRLDIGNPCFTILMDLMVDSLLYVILDLEGGTAVQLQELFLKLFGLTALRKVQLGRCCTRLITSGFYTPSSVNSVLLDETLDTLMDAAQSVLDPAALSSKQRGLVHGLPWELLKKGRIVQWYLDKNSKLCFICHREDVDVYVKGRYPSICSSPMNDMCMSVSVEVSDLHLATTCALALLPVGAFSKLTLSSDLPRELIIHHVLRLTEERVSQVSERSPSVLQLRNLSIKDGVELDSYLFYSLLSLLEMQKKNLQCIDIIVVTDDKGYHSGQRSDSLKKYASAVLQCDLDHFGFSFEFLDSYGRTLRSQHIIQEALDCNNLLPFLDGKGPTRWHGIQLHPSTCSDDDYLEKLIFKERDIQLVWRRAGNKVIRRNAVAHYIVTALLTQCPDYLDLGCIDAEIVLRRLLNLIDSKKGGTCINFMDMTISTMEHLHLAATLFGKILTSHATCSSASGLRLNLRMDLPSSNGQNMETWVKHLYKLLIDLAKHVHLLEKVNLDLSEKLLKFLGSPGNPEIYSNASDSASLIQLDNEFLESLFTALFTAYNVDMPKDEGTWQMFSAIHVYSRTDMGLITSNGQELPVSQLPLPAPVLSLALPVMPGVINFHEETRTSSVPLHWVLWRIRAMVKESQLSNGSNGISTNLLLKAPGQGMQLTRLVMAMFPRTSFEVREFAQLLREVNSLEVLDINLGQFDNERDWRANQELATAILDSPALRELTLRKNDSSSTEKVDTFSKLITFGVPDHMRQMAISSFRTAIGVSDEVLSQTPQDVLNYVRLLRTGAEYAYRCKLMLVGPGNVGKTTLIKRLLHGVFQRDPGQTDGLGVYEWALPITGIIPEEEQSKTTAPPIDVASIIRNEQQVGATKMSFSLWDFGGQEVYYSTHAFFMTKRAVYLVMYSARDDQQQSALQDFLERIQALAPGSPMLLVGTHAFEPIANGQGKFKPKQVCLASFLSEFPSLHPEVMYVSSKTGHGIDKLKRTVLELALKQPGTGELLPMPFVHLLEQVRRAAMAIPDGKEPVLHLDKYSVLAQAAGVTNPEELSSFTSLLCNYGIILYFKDVPGLDDVIILRPQWVADVMARVVTAEATKLDLLGINGQVKKRALHKLMKEVSKERASGLIYLMETFNLIHMVDDKTLLVPPLLPEGVSAHGTPLLYKYTKPEWVWWHAKYDYSYIPDALLCRLLCRLLSLDNVQVVDNAAWRFGAVMKRNDHMMLVSQDLHNGKKKRISVFVCGVTPENMGALVSSKLKDLLSTDFNGVQLENISYSCTYCMRLQQRSPGEISIRVMANNNTVAQGLRCTVCGEHLKTVMQMAQLDDQAADWWADLEKAVKHTPAEGSLPSLTARPSGAVGPNLVGKSGKRSTQKRPPQADSQGGLAAAVQPLQPEGKMSVVEEKGKLLSSPPLELAPTTPSAGIPAVARDGAQAMETIMQHRLATMADLRNGLKTHEQVSNNDILRMVMETQEIMIREFTKAMKLTVQIDAKPMPTLHVVLPEPSSGRAWWDIKGAMKARFRLHLLCEHPGAPHLTDHEGYEIERPLEWMRKCAPGLRVVAHSMGVLLGAGCKAITGGMDAGLSQLGPLVDQYVLDEPLQAFTKLNDLLTKLQSQEEPQQRGDSHRHQLDRGGRGSTDVVGERHGELKAAGAPAADGPVDSREPSGGSSQVQQALQTQDTAAWHASHQVDFKGCQEARREIEALIRMKDPNRVYGKLQKVATMSGDVLWLCKCHAEQYQRSATWYQQ